MTEAVIIDAVRTPGGKRGGQLKDWHPVDLAAEVLKELVKRNDLDPALIDDVILGCVMQTGEQAVNVARNAVLAAGFPETVPGTTIDRQCGSSQQAVHFAAQGVMAGVYDVVVAGGVEAMTRVPMGVTMLQGPGQAFGPAMLARYDHGIVPQGISAELIAERWGHHPGGVRPARVRLAHAGDAGNRGGQVRERDRPHRDQWRGRHP